MWVVLATVGGKRPSTPNPVQGLEVETPQPPQPIPSERERADRVSAIVNLCLVLLSSGYQPRPLRDSLRLPPVWPSRRGASLMRRRSSESLALCSNRSTRCSHCRPRAESRYVARTTRRVMNDTK